MKHINEYNKYQEEHAIILDVKERVDNYIADLIDKGFVVNVNKGGGLKLTSSDLRLIIRIIAPITLEYLWKDLEDYIIPVVKMLYVDYKVVSSCISLWEGESFYIQDEDDLDKTETLFADRKEELDSIDFKSYSILIEYPL